MNKDIPIIFSGPMIRALWQDRKTMTRRLLLPAPELFAIDDKGTLCDVGIEQIEGDPRPRLRLGRVILRQELKYAVGDRLWVKETWARTSVAPILETIDNPWIVYREEDSRTDYGGPWKSPLHMSRKDSRLTLIVTGVKVERVQDISRDDAIAEGATMRPKCRGYSLQEDGWSMDWSEVGQPAKYASGKDGRLTEEDVCLVNPQQAFGAYINELHGGKNWNLKPTNLWDQNPWVIAPTFAVHKQNIDKLESNQAAAA